MTVRTLALTAAAILAFAASAEAREEVRIVGSSTVQPFSSKVAQEFQNKTGLRVVVEPTGSGSGHEQFCAGVGESFPDITNSSRKRKRSEAKLCKENGADDAVEVKIGYDGIVISNVLNGPELALSLEHVYLAFAQKVPAKGTALDAEQCELVTNPYVKWSEIDASLPDIKIEAFGPPPTSGTRDAFVELAMEGGARRFACLNKLEKDDFTVAAHTLREDGGWVDAGENDNAIVQTLVRTPSAVGVFGYSFLDQNKDKIKAAIVNDVVPSLDAISTGDYPISRSLYFYIKRQHVGTVVKKGIKEYALEFTSEEAWGPGGYLEKIGLIPLPEDQREKYRERVEGL